MINSQPKIPFLGVVFDVDHDFEGPKAPKAHVDTVNRNLLDHLRRPRTTVEVSKLTLKRLCTVFQVCCHKVRRHTLLIVELFGHFVRTSKEVGRLTTQQKRRVEERDCKLVWCTPGSGRSS